MIIIDSLPTEIQVSKHSSEIEGLSFSLFGTEGEAFTTNVIEVDGLHYKVSINKDIREGTYRYQVQKDNHIIEVGLLKFKQPSQTNEVYEVGSNTVVYYE